jgi:galactokinase
MDLPRTVVARAPGRVNLVGDHTDYTGGLVAPMAIDRWVEITGEPGGTTIDLTSGEQPGRASVDLAGVATTMDGMPTSSGWARYVEAVARLVGSGRGLRGSVRSTIPIGAGLSSSAALEVALALALGFDGTPLELARLCRRAEHDAVGVPCGIMDQLTSAAGREGHFLVIDCHTELVEYVPLGDIHVVVIDSGVGRDLAASEYADRVVQCHAVEAEIGPLRLADRGDLAQLTVPLLVRRARHVITENERVREFVAAMTACDHHAAGRLMGESHASLRDDYEVSVPPVDDLVASVAAAPGVFGARMTGGGFGGCVVALCEPGALLERWPGQVRAVGGAEVQISSK